MKAKQNYLKTTTTTNKTGKSTYNYQTFKMEIEMKTENMKIKSNSKH